MATASETLDALRQALRAIQRIAHLGAHSEAPLSEPTLRALLDDIAIHAGRSVDDTERKAAA